MNMDIKNLTHSGKEWKGQLRGVISEIDRTTIKGFAAVIKLYNI